MIGKNYSLKQINDHLKGSLSDLLDIEFIEVGDDFLRAKMVIGSKHLQPMQIMHGGASCVFAETVGSVAANCCVNQELKACVGLEINVNHIRPVQSGTLFAIARPYHLGKTTQVWEIKMMNEEKKLVSVSRLTVAVIDKARL